jgi:hypothetical protein
VHDLIEQYTEGKRQLRKTAKLLKRKIDESDDAADLMDLNNDLSLINGMIRDMTEAIGLMSSPFHKARGERKEILMDPHMISTMDLTEEKWDPTEEDAIRRKVLDEFEMLIKRRIDLLTNKQKSTLIRWIYDVKTFSEIAQEDGVSRQAIWDRIFGNKSHAGALRKLREGR